MPLGEVVIDLETMTIAYTCPFGSSEVAVSDEYGQFVTATGSRRQGTTLRILRLSDFEEIASLEIDPTSAGSLLRWTTDGLAWRDFDSVIIARTALLTRDP